MTAEPTTSSPAKSRFRPGFAALASTLLVAAGAVSIAASGSAADATTIYPSQVDQKSVGGIQFFDAGGKPVTGGALTDKPIAAFVEGTETIRSGDTKATLYGTLPEYGVPSGNWTSTVLGGPSTYPNSAAPGTLGSSSLPLYTGASTDESVSSLVADDGRPTSDGYSGIYQLRLVTTQAGSPANTTYDSADISVDESAGTWAIVYDRTPATSTTTVLTVSKSGAVTYGTSVTLTAKVTPQAALGSVSFYDGKTLLKKVALANGTATYTTKTLSDASHSLKAVFAPTGTAYATSTSSTKTLTVRAHGTKTTLRPSNTSIAHGKKLTLTATASPAEGGKVAFLDGKKTLKSVSLPKSGKVAFSTTSLGVGSHQLIARYTPANTKAYAASTSSKVKVTVKK